MNSIPSISQLEAMPTDASVHEQTDTGHSIGRSSILLHPYQQGNAGDSLPVSPFEKLINTETTLDQSHHKISGHSLGQTPGHAGPTDYTPRDISALDFVKSPFALSFDYKDSPMQHQTEAARHGLSDAKISAFHGLSSNRGVPNPEPNFIEGLNLQLAHKDLIIQQVHRAVSDLDRQVERSPGNLVGLYELKLRQIRQIVGRDRHRPVIISQKILEPRRAFPGGRSSDLQSQMRASSDQLSRVRDKLCWFEKQNSALI